MTTFQSQINILAKAICQLKDDIPTKESLAEQILPKSYQTKINSDSETTTITSALNKTDMKLTLGTKTITISHLGHQAYTAIQVGDKYIHSDGTIDETENENENEYVITTLSTGEDQSVTITPIISMALSAETTAVL